MTSTARVRTYISDEITVTVSAKFAADGNTVEAFEVHQYDQDAGETVERRSFPSRDPMYQACALSYAELCVAGCSNVTSH